MTTKTQAQGVGRRKRVILSGIVGAALAGVTLLPGTGWIVRQQVQTLFSGPMSVSAREQADSRLLQRQEKVAASRPADFPLQMALAIRREPARATAAGVENAENSKLTALHRLEPEYSDEPSLYAAILRDLSRGAVKLDHRTEQFELEAPRKESERKAAPVSAEAIAEWRRAAERGGALDPDNAFFPLMHAVGLFAESRDTEALAEIKRAGSLPRYEDYVRDEATGSWALAQAGQNEPIPSLPRAAISAATLLPHYAVMRAASRLAVVQAMHLEQAGNVEEGFAVRQALARCGARMRTDSSWLIGNFVGEAIAATAQARPGGAPPLPNSIKGEAKAAQRVQRYEAYLTQIGHTEEIPWVRHEESARKDIKVITKQGLDQGPASMLSLIAVTVQWGVGVCLLGNMLWMVLLGAFATWLAKTRTVRSGERLPSAVAWGVAISLFTAVSAGAVGVAGGSAGSAFAGALAAIALCFAASRLVPDRSRPSLHATFPAAALTKLMVGILYWTSSSGAGYATWTKSTFGMVQSDDAARDALILLLSIAAMTVVPFLTWASLAIASRFRRVPVSVGTVRGFARAALPIAAILSIGYVGLVGVTSVREAAALKGLEASVQHEGRACAGYVGRSWPTFAP